MLLRGSCKAVRGMVAILAFCAVGDGVKVQAIPPVQGDSILTRPLALGE